MSNGFFFEAYGFNQPLIGIPPNPIVRTIDPGPSNKEQIGTIWCNTATDAVFILASIKNNMAHWVPVSNFSLGTTDHAVQVGNATGGIKSIPVGTDGTLLQGFAGADPAFTNNVVISAPISGNTLEIYTDISPSAGGPAPLSIYNSANDIFGTAIRLNKNINGGAVSTGITLSEIESRGFDGTNYILGAQIIATVTGVVSPGIVPTTIFTFTMDAAGVIGIRTTLDPNGLFLIQPANGSPALAAQGNVATGTIQIQAADPTTPQAVFSTQSSLGTFGSPLPLTNGNTIGSFRTFGWDGTNFTISSSITTLVDGSVSTGIVPSDMLFSTTDSSGNLNVNMTLDRDGNLTVENAIVGASVGANFDLAGTGGTTSLSNATVASSTGVNTLLATTATGGKTNDGYIKMYVGTTPVFVPFFINPS